MSIRTTQAWQFLNDTDTVPRVGITVDELLHTPHLRLRLHSGEQGLSREVTWTHTSDVPEPWQWITGGEMLMTNGLSFPKRASDQEKLLQRLDEAGISALAIGEQMYCPALTRRLEHISNRLALPVLWIRYPLPFVAISRAVAEATLLEQSQRLTKTARIYDTIRHTTTALPGRSQLVDALTREIGCETHVCHRDSGQPWYPEPPPLEAAVAQAVSEAPKSSRRLAAGAFTKTLPDNRDVVVLHIPTHEHAVLVFVRNPHTTVDAILLQHAATVVALELSQTQLALEHDRRFGAELLAQLLDNQIEPTTGDQQLARLQLTTSEAVLITARTTEQERIRELHIALWRRNIPHMCLHRNGLVHAVLPDRNDLDTVLTAALGHGHRTGISRPITTTSRITDATREATWALNVAERTDTPLARYGDAAPWLGLTDIAEAQALVDRVLHPLLDYDDQHQSELIRTLQHFLINQRSWQRTATALHVHRQTVLYRIKKIEQITHRNLAETNDITELWLALRALQLTTPNPV